MSEFSGLLHSFTKRKRASCKQLEKLCGKLNWASRVISGGRTFMRRIIDMKANVAKSSHMILLSHEFFADLYWWISFMSVFNGTCKIRDTRPITSVQTDACDAGAGGYFNGDFFYTNWMLDFPAMVMQHINVKELVAIILAVIRWCISFRDKCLVIYTDNVSAASFINKGTSRNPVIMYFLRLLLWMCAYYNFSVRAVYLPSCLNTRADACSRIHEPGKLSLVFDLIPSLQLETFSVQLLLRHMSYTFIHFRFFRARSASKSGIFQKQGVG
ncbi:hypothetical protein KUTeg_010579 [Tegillarca granosa]|uniref:Reverse transcriptase RNase H-like domain-containing protein n=1 Tax=Tegillarca granosa TaxID=220873 RepID=A0ABQ9F388_TEGGR|nr:hypothetical protein KUTeg_010579 [Tegillarca granosa]